MHQKQQCAEEFKRDSNQQFKDVQELNHSKSNLANDPATRKL
jgi:hypothetical protein